MNLIITSGGSQLLTQISVLRKLNYDLSDFYLIYNGVFNDSLDSFFSDIKSTYHFKDYMHINFNMMPFKLNFKRFFKSIINFKSLVDFSKVDEKFKNLKKFKNSNVLIIPVRVKVFSDILLLTYLNPRKSIFVVDGVIDEVPNRNFDGFEYFYLNKELKKLPTKQKVFSPNYLINEADKIGASEVVSIDKTIEEFYELAISKRFKEQYLNNDIKYIFFSQHFSLTENVSIENEVLFIKNVISKLEFKENDQLLYKPHPRDTKDKIQLIEKLNNPQVKIVSSDYQALPIELYYEFCLKNQIILLTCNSSAPLIFKNNLEIIILKSNTFFNKKLNNKISNFANQYHLKILDI